MNINIYRLLQWLALLACGMWMGMLVFLGVAVAPAIFKFMDSKTQAGLLNGIILYKMNILEGICAVILLTTSVFLFIQRKSRLHLIGMIGSLLLLLNLAYYGLVITPHMGELKQTIQDFDLPRDQDPRPEREEFDRLHNLYSSIVKVNVIVLLVLSLIIMYTPRRDEA